MALYAALLLLTLIIGLWRVLRGPGRVDRLLVVQLFGTSGTALLLVLAQLQGPGAARCRAGAGAAGGDGERRAGQLLRRSRHE